jgi:hypothetical protein
MLFFKGVRYWRTQILLRSGLFRDTMQRTMVISHRRFGITLRSHFQGFHEYGTDRKSRNVGKELPLYLRCVISQKSADPIYIAAEAWNHAGIVILLITLHIEGTSHSAVKDYFLKTATHGTQTLFTASVPRPPRWTRNFPPLTVSHIHYRKLNG